MPPYILPKSLFNITLLKVQALVTYSCTNIECMYGSYDSEKCKEAVNDLQQYLLLNIPGLVFDEVYKERNRYLNACVKFQDKLRDQRISLAVYINHNMRSFSIIDRYHHEDENFWISHFCKLHNIIVLDLHLICTDEILEVVGRTCFKLEEINIVSKLEPESLNDVYSRPFNALKLRFFVSDQGLEHLSNCKKLKKVTMNKMLRSQFGGRMMTDAGIRNLVRSLPCLETVTYDDMGVVISEGMDDLHTLPLKYLSDHHPNSSHIKSASRLCVNLKHLCLHLHNQASDRSMAASDILETLTNSNLQLETLELLMFPCTEDLLSLLKVKGQLLTSLTLQTCYSLFAESSVRVIGQSCPNLATLNLKEVGCKSIQLSTSDPIEHQNSMIAEPLFCNLLHLSIVGIRWRPDIVLPLCLSHAKLLQSLTVIKFKDNMLLDQTFTQILITNPLTELTCIIGCVISMATIKYFIRQCPKLERLYFVHHSSIKLDDIQQLEYEIKYSNLKLKLESMGMHAV